MSKKSRLIISFIGLPLFAVLFSPFISNAAASDYGISITDNIHIGGNSSRGECAKTNMVTRWAEFMSDDPADEWSYKNTWNYKTNSDYARYKLDAFRERFVANLATGSGWAVTAEDGETYGTGVGDHMAIRIILFDPPDSDLTISTSV